MKLRRMVLTALAALIYTAALAIPARPGAFEYTQPDGSVIMLERHGDEFFSWTTLAGSSQVMELGEDGFWHKSTLDLAAEAAGRRQRNRINMSRAAGLRTHNNDPMTHGERHIPVLLVNFSDLSFRISNPQTQFSNLLNQRGYSGNGATGSVQDFYVDNSHGAFTPVFDVYGPVTLSNTMAYYGAHPDANNNDTCPEVAVYEAAMALDAEIDFSRYDYNNDGTVDMILMYYAGYNEAEGGPQNSIWPHQWSVQNSSNSAARRARPDGKALGTYFCTSELNGSSGSNMCGIGTTCHEFGHSLGLPDFYDTDYSTNGSAGALYNFSTMCSGSYNNNGRTPPYFNSEERILLGWLMDSDIPTLPEGNVTFESVKDDYAFRTPTDTEGEYFLYECRDGSGWDAPIPSGMLVYHVDKSKSHNVGGLSAYNHWYYWNRYNMINAFGSHPCFYVVPAANQSSLNFTGSTSQAVFPGNRRITTYTPVDWDGNDTGVSISGISYSGGKVTLNATYSNEKSIVGTVSGQDNKPISGVKVVLSGPSTSKKAPRGIAPRAGNYEATTDSNGAFNIPLDGYEAASVHLTFSKEGYQTLGLDQTLNPRTTTVSVTLLKVGETEVKDYSYFDSEGQIYLGGEPSLGKSQMAAIRIAASELPKSSGKLLSVTIFPYTPAQNYYIVADSGKDRILTYKVNGVSQGVSDFVTIDLSDSNAVFPGGTDLYVGIAVENSSSDYDGYPFIITPGNSNHTYYSSFNLTSSSWSYQEVGYNLVLSATIAGISGDGGTDDPVDPDDPEQWSLAKMGFNSIVDPGNGSYKAGSSFALKLSLVEGVTANSAKWQYDGIDVSGAKSITLVAGEHLLTAQVTLSNGTRETLQLKLNVE